VVFGGFSSEALRDRINDCGSKILITADGYYRGGRIVQNKVNADEALKECPAVGKVIVVKRLGMVPVSITAPEQYTALERRTIDGILQGPPAITMYKLEEVAKYYFKLPVTTGVTMVTVNNNTWNKLPADIKGIIE
jgi:acyl-coenzyme A synthetase/AMP-(fatty) acid ligase